MFASNIITNTHFRNRNTYTNLPELDEDIVKVVVIGEPRVGKTSFIRAFYDHHQTYHTSFYKGIRQYPCEFSNGEEHCKAVIFEIPGDLGVSLEHRKPHLADANVIVLMYAVDNPSSFEKITEKWLPKTRDMIMAKDIPVVVIGNKSDLRDDPKVIDRLALDGQKPVSFNQGENLQAIFEIVDFMEISTKNLEEANKAFDLVFSYVLDNEW